MIRTLACLLAVVSSSTLSLQAEESGRFFRPFYTASNNYAPTRRAVVDDANEVKVIWDGPEHMGCGKGLSSSLFAMTVKAMEDKSIAFYGGASSLVAADGRVFCYYARPSGPMVRNPDKTSPSQLVNHILADDILVALDAVTGKVVWKAIEKQTNINIGGGKRFHWTNSPAIADGRIVFQNVLGRYFCYELATGKKLWDTPASEEVQRRVELAVKEGRKVSREGRDGVGMRQQSPVIADGVIFDRSGHAGYSLTDGRELWAVDPETDNKRYWATRNSYRASPAVWKHEGKEYVLINTGYQHTLVLLDPQTGDIVWTVKHGGSSHTPNLQEDYLVWPVRPSKTTFTDHKNRELVHGVWGCYRLTLDGPEIIWELPDDPAHWAIRPGGDRSSDRVVTYGDGVVWLNLYGVKDRGTGTDRGPNGYLLDLKTGRKIAQVPREAFEGTGTYPGEFGNFIDRQHYVDLLDTSHTANTTTQKIRLFKVDYEKGQITFLGRCEAGGQFVAIGGYEVGMDPPMLDGRLYFRSNKGVACLDFCDD